RPIPIRRETDVILSYYQSADAGRAYTAPDADPDATRTRAQARLPAPSAPRSAHGVDSSSGSGINSDVRSPALTHRRTSTRSIGGSDKRRVAIVEMDPAALDALHLSLSDGNERSQASPSVASTLLSRRGVAGSFALVAPADASPSTYTDLTPPLSAPAVPSGDSAADSASALGRHQRSHSEAVAGSKYTRPGHPNRLRKSSRDIGIVGMSTKSRMDAMQASQTSPIFQTPSLVQTSLHSSDDFHSSAEPHTSSSATSKEAKRHSQQLLNGHASRGARDENTGPVAVGVNPNQMWQSPSTQPTYAPLNSPPPTSPQHVTSPQAVSNAYLYYQPGIHATAGPLPRPPTTSSPSTAPPPRPPRLHTPTLGSSVFAKRQSDTSIQPTEQSPAPAITPSTTSSTLVNSQSEDSVKSGHVREGAFPVTSVIITDATPPRQATKHEQHQQALKRKNTMDDLIKDVTHAIDEADELKRDADPPLSPIVVEPLRSATKQESATKEKWSGLELRHEKKSRSTFKGEPLSRSASSDYSDYGDTASKPLPDPFAHAPAPRSAESHESGSKRSRSPHKMLDFALKRFSTLPRPPSGLSVSKISQHSSLSQERVSPERTSPRPKVVFVAKIRSPWPDAMAFGDVMARKGSLERSLGYAQKINELAKHDPGLGDWVVSMKNELALSPVVASSPAVAQSPSERSFTFQPRHISRGSVGSEMTFPKRVDAYVATDLLVKPSEDQTLPKGPPPLPYPTLAQGTPVLPTRSFGGSSASSMRSIPSTLGGSKSGGGGFFSSLGRKTSINRKDRAAGAGAPSSKLLSKRQQTLPMPPPRAVQISASPSLPGGPRAPPGRVQRAQSVITSRTPTPSVGPLHVESESEATRQIAIKRSPSLAPLMARSTTGNGNGPAAMSESSPEFNKKMASLVDLLPHADKSVLSGYLRRAGGQDILAIGRYLDDEKNNSLRRN
ncbi:hypothetical protein DFH11DRAFT_1502246, partial [Phellopilus nigrolimitatus]